MQNGMTNEFNEYSVRAEEKFLYITIVIICVITLI